MQAPPTSQRSIQRRSPAADPGPPPNVPPRAMSPGPGPQPRASTASARSLPNGGSRKQNINQNSQNGNSTAQPLSQIEKSVTHLLVATKQLLETLTQWSRHQATDAQVSDVYVRLGYEFNIACRAFTSINVDTTDLGNVPELLRHILESTLSQEASVESLERYLPRIRDIIINLLHGLKRKQQRLRQKQPRDAVVEAPIPRNSSVSSTGSAGTGLTTLLDQGISNSFRAEGDNRDSSAANDNAPRMSSQSAPAGRTGPSGRDQARTSNSSDQSSMSSTTMQNIPVMPPYPGDELQDSRAPREDLVESFPPPPPVPPKQQNALAALQRGGDLERRASRRYSAYQISKHLGERPNGVPMLPPAQNSPVPNRGRNDARESMRAVQTRGNQQHSRQQSRLAAEYVPGRVPSQVLEEVSESPAIQEPGEAVVDSRPTVATPEDKLRRPVSDFEAPSATLQGPPPDVLPAPPEVPSDDADDESPNDVDLSKSRQSSTFVQQNVGYRSEDGKFSPEPSPPPSKDLTLFLQYKSKVKKFVLPEGETDLSIAKLQLAFIEKFSWNTHNNGVDLPDIYIQDPISGIRHELEDLSDIKDRSVLVLNVEVLDEVKRHFDEGLGGIRKIVEGVRIAVEDQQTSIQRVSDRQNDAAKEIAKMAAAPPIVSRASYIDSQRNGPPISPSKVNSQSQISEIQSLRRDLAVLRQTYSNFQSEVQNGMSNVRTKATALKTIATKATIPVLDGESGRAHIFNSKKSMDQTSDKLVGQVDDLQDIVEDLRKDVVMRGVRPLGRQLETVAKDIAQATKELVQYRETVKRERPLWNKIWEKELEVICNEREELTMQEQLAADLEDDLDKAQKTFALVEQATKEQMKDAPGAAGTRIPSRGLNHITPAADPSIAKEGVLGEVRALQPNHENRLEAIERAEKLRQKELESRRGGEFQKELGNFVEERKLKKSGGFEEVERARKAKDERMRKEVWERQNGMTQADAMAAEEAEPVEDAELNEEEVPQAAAAEDV